MLRSLLSRLRRTEDPYEDFYLNARPVDLRNLVVHRIRQAPEGSVFAVKAETHTPEIMASHVKELGRFLGADAVHIAAAGSLDLTHSSATAAHGDKTPEDAPFAVFMLFRAEQDPRESPGIGGQVGALKAAFATFQLSAIIREFGFHATRVSLSEPDRAAASVGLGSLDGAGRLRTAKLGIKLHIADVILTDLPVTPD